MNFKTGLSLLVGTAVVMGGCTTWNKSDDVKRGVAGASAVASSDQEVLGASSSGKLKLKRGRIIIDNDQSFEQKMAIIMNPKVKRLYLTYYIYSDDYSSSKFNQALIARAQQGVKVKLIVDLATNYSRMDLFRLLEAQGNGNLEVRFYNRPSANIQEDAYYLTLPCSKENQTAAKKDACEAEKKTIVENGKKNGFTPQQQMMQKLYLASYYTKNGAGLKVATVGGQEIDIAHATSVMEADKAKKDDFLALGKSGKKVKDTGSISAGLKAKSLLTDLVNEIDPTLNLLTGFLPQEGIQKTHKDDWDHISDYTHQKLILGELDNGEILFQLGGRNIEDSYHLKTDFLKQLKGDERQKYLFRDTDFYGEVVSGGKDIISAYMRNWDFKEMTASTAEMDAVAPVDLSIGVYMCSATAGKDKVKFEQCVGEFFQKIATDPSYISAKAKERVMAAAQNMATKAATFAAEYEEPTKKSTKKQSITIRGLNKSDELSANDLNTALVTYVENLNTSKDVNPSKRTFGAYTGKEMDSGKYISHLWIRGMENACASGQETQVILHSAYLLPASSLVKTLGNMFDGSWDCSKVTVKIITNSFETTDLNIINIFARAQLQALFDKYFTGYNVRSARLAYYEYVKESGQTQSLHTKLSVLGDDMIIGSANADVRSYYMDSNNGVYLRGVKDLVADYREFVDELIRSGAIVEKSSMFATYDASVPKWTLKDHMPDVSKMTDDVIDYWINRSKATPPAEVKVKHATAIRYAKKILRDMAHKAYVYNKAMLTGEYKPSAADIREACGSGQNSGYADSGYGSNNEYENCVSKLTSEGIASADPDFNLDFEAF